MFKYDVQYAHIHLHLYAWMCYEQFTRLYHISQITKTKWPNKSVMHINSAQQIK